MDYLELSKEVSYALRHAPWEYELEMDEEGWVDIKKLLGALKQSLRWEKLNISDLETMLIDSDKKRYEIAEGKIRAFYGHSIPTKILKINAYPPRILYHGTARCFLHSILQEGLKPNQRQDVHLSSNMETALRVGKRRDEQPVILAINAEIAYMTGVKFYYGNEMVWLADDIPSKYITVVET